MCMKIKLKATELNERQKRFCVEYLKDLNASQAAKRAGYVNKGYHVQALRMLQNPTIHKYLSEEFTKIKNKAEVDVEFVLRELLQIANCDIGEAFRPDGSLKPIHQIPTPVRKCIAGFENEEIFEMVETTEKGRKVREWVGTLRKVKFWPKDRGLEMLGKYLAMFTEKHEMSGPGGQPLPAVTVNVIKTIAPAIDRVQTVVASNAT